MQASASLTMSTTSTARYTVRFSGQAIETTVTSSAASVDEWVRDVRSAHRGRGSMIVGLDCEWKPNTYVGQCNKVATLQLCVGSKCLILQLFYVDYIPESIKSFLADVSVTFVGVEVGDDVGKLRSDYGLRCQEWKDLEPLCREYLRMSAYDRKKGLRGYAREILGVVMDKPMHVTRSNWENGNLTAAQVQYGCIDAYVSYRLGCKVLQ